MAITTKSATYVDVINSVLTHLFAFETERHQRCIDKIAMEHNLGWTTFMHRAQTFRPTKAQPGQPRRALPEAAWPDMEKFLRDKDQVEQDSKKFWQILFSMINPCNTLQDVRDTLPDFIVEMVPQLVNHPRLRDEAFTLDEPRTKRQYDKLREKMELYATISKNPGIAQLMAFYHYEA